MTSTRRYSLASVLAAFALSGLFLAPMACAASSTPQSSNVTINARNVDLGDLISLLATQSGINVVVDGTVVPHPVTLRLNHVPFNVAMDTIEHGYGLAQAWENGVLHIGPPETINRMFPASASISQRMFALSNADATFVAAALQNVLPTGTIIIADPRTGTVLVKSDPNTIATANEIVSRLDKPRFNSESYSTVAIPMNNMKASDALAILRTELIPNPSQSLAASDHPNAVLATGSQDFIASAKGLLFEIDRPGKQVRFKVRVTDISPINDTSNVGVLFGGISAGGAIAGGSGSTFTAFANKTLPINATLNLLASTSQAKILAEPEISTLDNEKAVLNVGEQYPISVFNPQTGTNEVQFINAGVNLTVTPIIGGDGDITVTLDTDYSQILSFVNSYPVIGTRHVANVFRVGSDETIVIAGLFEDISSDTVQKVPVLGDIPILGTIFRNRTKSHTRDEIVFLITPHIVDPSDFKPARPSATP